MGALAGLFCSFSGEEGVETSVAHSELLTVPGDRQLWLEYIMRVKVICINMLQLPHLGGTV